MQSILSKIKQSLIRYKITHPPVAILASRRGGSTLLAETLSFTPKTACFLEPFARFPEHINYPITEKWLPPRMLSQYFDLNEEEEQKISRYIQACFKNQTHMGICKRPQLQLVCNRILFKIVNASMLMDWLQCHFGFKFLYLSRHPAPQTISVQAQNWGLTNEAYLSRPEFLGKVMESSQIEKAIQISKEGSNWERYTLNWVFENWYPLKVAAGRCELITYEELLLYPKATLRKIEKKFSMTMTNECEHRLSQPSSSTKYSSVENQRLLNSGNRTALISTWKTKITKGDLKRMQAILDTFEIDCYSMYDELPITMRKSS